jgi:hypothetical protein
MALSQEQLASLIGLKFVDLFALVSSGDLKPDDVQQVIEAQRAADSASSVKLSIGPSGQIVFKCEGCNSATQSPSGWQKILSPAVRQMILAYCNENGDVSANQKKWAKLNPEKAAEIASAGGRKAYYASKRKS